MRATCRLCREPLPAMFGGAYPLKNDPHHLARIYCCPTCVAQHGWQRACLRASCLVTNDRQHPKQAQPSTT